MVITFDASRVKFQEGKRLLDAITLLMFLFVISALISITVFLGSVAAAVFNFIFTGKGDFPEYGVISFEVFLVSMALLIILIYINRWLVMRNLRKGKTIVLDGKKIVYDPDELVREVDEKWWTGERVVCESCRQIVGEVLSSYM